MIDLAIWQVDFDDRVGPERAGNNQIDRQITKSPNHQIGLGTDAKACPCKTMVPLYRTHVFAQIRPATQTRIDLGLWLATVTDRVPSRIVPTGGLEKGDRITHRIEISSLGDIDATVTRWLRAAYEADGPLDRGKRVPV